ncbi:O-antigen ligase family protein [Lysobacter sp. A289]
MRHEGSGAIPDAVAEAALALLIVVALAFGGGSRGMGDLMVHLVAVPVLALAVLRWRHAAASRLQRLLLLTLLAGFALTALQLLPLPAAAFAALPQRSAVLADLHTAGLQPAWLPMTLDRWGTIRALLALATFCAAWMLACTLTPQSRERLLKLTLVAASVMALVGFAQAAAGSHSSLRPYDYHHPMGAIGAFANRNHFADLLAMLLPFALAFGIRGQRDRQPGAIFAWYGVAVMLFLAAALSYSRTGFALACVAVVASLLVLRPGSNPVTKGQGKRFAPLLALGAGALAVGYYAWDGIVRRLEQDPLEDLRWQYVAHGIDAATAYLPWGSGLGSFRDAYAPFEPVGAMVNVHALHAHNDSLEIAVEAGLPGLLLLLAFLALLLAAGWTALRQPPGEAKLVLAAAVVAACVPLAHSLVDYPLRTLSIASVFGLVVAVLVSAGHRSPVAASATEPIHHQSPGGD